MECHSCIGDITCWAHTKTSDRVGQVILGLASTGAVVFVLWKVALALIRCGGP